MARIKLSCFYLSGWLLGFLWLFLGSFILPSDDDLRWNRIRENLLTWQTEYGQQKVYLHLDRTDYKATETIWFKAYLLDAATHLPDTRDKNLYVELINPKNHPVQAKLIRMQDGAGLGEFDLQDTVPEGNYLIRAYTSWMLNFDPDFYFQQTIFIHNPENSNFISNEDIRNNKRFNRNLDKLSRDFDIQFLPEGGWLVAGINCRVAFKAIDGLGQSIPVKGKVLNKAGEELANIDPVYKGMGSFTLQAEKGNEYYALVSYMGEKERKFKLPEVMPEGYSMQVVRTDEKVIVSVAANLSPSSDPLFDDVFLLIQSRGIEKYSDKQDLVDGKTQFSIPANLLPEGISQVTAFNGRGMAVAERLIFMREENQAKIIYGPIPGTVTARNRMEYPVQFMDSKGAPLQGNFSFSVSLSDKNNIAVKSLKAALLLSSDLKGYIENPDSLLLFSSKKNDEALDLIMLTNGWRRFLWNDLLSGNKPEIKFPHEKSITITGKITRELFAIPLKNIRVYLTVLNAYNDYYKTTSDENGRFLFEGLDYADTLQVEIEATKPNGRRNLVIALDQEGAPGAGKIRAGLLPQELLAKGENWKYGNVKRIDYSDQPEKKAKMEKTKDFKIHGDADNVIYMDDMPPGYNDMMQVIQGRVPGLITDGNNVIIRGPSSIMLSNDPLFLIDGIPVDINAFRMLNPRDVEIIEILKGPSTAIYGSRGANGVIAVYTKRGDFMRKGFLDFSMLGYHTPREFYSPRYEFDEIPEPGTDTRKTLLWDTYVKTDSTGTALLKFYTSDITGNFRLRIEGISTSGKPVSFYRDFLVEKE